MTDLIHAYPHWFGMFGMLLFLAITVLVWSLLLMRVRVREAEWTGNGNEGMHKRGMETMEAKNAHEIEVLRIQNAHEIEMVQLRQPHEKEIVAMLTEGGKKARRALRATRKD